MEIMTTWNTDFEFDLQRFTDLPSIKIGGSGDSSLSALTAATTENKYNIYYLDSSNKLQVQENKDDAGTLDPAVDGSTVICGVKSDNTVTWAASANTAKLIIEVQEGEFAASTNILGATYAAAGSTARFTITNLTNAKKIVNTSGVVTTDATDPVFVVTSGDLTVGGDYAANVSAESTSISFTADALGGAKEVTTKIGTVTLTEATNATATKVTSNGVVTGVEVNGTVAWTNNKAGNTISINGASMTSDDTDGLTFTALSNGVKTVTGLAASKYITGVPEDATVTALNTGTYTINGQKIVLANDSAATVTAKNGGIKSVVGTNTTALKITGWTDAAGYTINGETVKVSNSSDEIDITCGVPASAEVAPTTGIVTIDKLAAGSELTINDSTGAPHAGVSVTTEKLVAKDTTSESSVVTVNGTKFYAGRDIAGASSTQLTVETTANGAYLVTGTAYLDGSSSSEVVVAAAGADDDARVTIKATKGDISVTAAGGVWTVNDLDNGDSFTAEVGGNTVTYQVVNGVLYNVTSGAANAGAKLAVGTEGKYSLSIAATGAGANTVGNASLKSNVYASSGDAIGETKNISLTVDSKPYSPFVVGSTNYLHENGVLDTDSSNAIGTVTYDDNAEVYTYSNTSNKAQTITVGGNDKWVVNGGEKADTITGNGKESTLNGGSGNDTIDAGAKDVAFGGDGNDSIKASAAGASISGGAGNDTLEATVADATLTGGDGSDVFKFGNGLITDYNFNDDVVYVNDTMANITKNAKFSSDGLVTLSGAGAVTLSAADSYAVKFKSNDDKTQVIAWAGENSTNIDGSSLTSPAIIYGNTNDAADSLIGGSKDDTIIAGTGDSVYGGAGSNTISLTGSTAETVYFNGVGKNDVTGFVAGFNEETSDKLIIDGISSLTSSADNSNVTIKSGSSNVVLNNVVTSGVAKVRVGDKKAIFASDTATVKLESLTDADYYFGTKGSSSSSKLDLSAIEESVNVDLSNDAVIRNFTSVKGGAGNTTLIGSKANETLAAGAGNASLYGGAGKDVLQGTAKSKDTFFMFSGGGNDTVTGFEGYTESTADTADVVFMDQITGAKLISGGVQLSGQEADKLFLSGANANTEIQYQIGESVGIAKIGSVSGANNFTFAKEVNYYGGGSAVDTLTFGSSDSDNHEVWLDGSKGTAYASIDVINAANATGDLVLAGDSSKNTITGGKGSSSLWGGTGAVNDVIKGGTGKNTFFYGLAEGNDTITCGTADDVVNLYNVSLADVASGEITSSAVTVVLKDESKLTVNTGSRDIAFKLSDGSTWTANHSTKQWDNA